MSCNTCAKSFSMLRKEHGCPGCGFSYCSKCLNHTAFITKLDAEKKVCLKCKTSQDDNKKPAVEPPAAYLKRLEALDNPSRPPITMYEQDKYQKLKRGLSVEDQQMVDRLQHLREDRSVEAPAQSVEQQIVERLKRLRGLEDAAGTSHDQVQARLSNLKGEPARQSSVSLPPADLRSDQEKSDDILRQYAQEANIDASHKQAFDSRIDSIESRLHALTGTSKPADHGQHADSGSEDEEEVVRKLVEKAKAEAALESEVLPSTTPRADTAELPWCEICNEDARWRCRGCSYLFCQQCSTEHKDEDFGCNSFEPYEKPKNAPA